MLRLVWLLLFALLAPTSAQDGVAPSVALSGAGTVVGVTNSTTGLDEFLGIPYAQPPVGLLRFAAPLPLSNDAARLIRATEYGHVCPQQPSVNASSTTQHSAF
jgi:acetylcholinesterase